MTRVPPPIYGPYTGHDMKQRRLDRVSLRWPMRSETDLHMAPIDVRRIMQKPHVAKLIHFRFDRKPARNSQSSTVNMALEPQLWTVEVKFNKSGWMPAMYVKICGLRTPETVAAALDAGADAMGFVFAPGSPRTITAERAAELIGAVPAGVETVGVFRNQPIDEVVATALLAGVSTVQLHGDEGLADMARLHAEGFRTLRAFSATSYTSLDNAARAAWDSERLLLDAVEPGAGTTFDAAILFKGTPQGFWLLAGGLNPGNVAALSASMGPSGVDVSSGVESSRGVKDARLIRDFVKAVRPS